MFDAQRDQAKEILSKQAVKIATKAEEHERFIFKVRSSDPFCSSRVASCLKIFFFLGGGGCPCSLYSNCMRNLFILAGIDANALNERQRGCIFTVWGHLGTM